MFGPTWEVKQTHLCGRTEAEDNAEDQVGVSCSE